MEPIIILFVICPVLLIIYLFFKVYLEMSHVDIGAYFSAVYRYFRMWIRGSMLNVFSVMIVLCLFCLWFFDYSVIYTMFQINDPEVKKLNIELITLVTVVVGFGINYFFNMRTNKKKSEFELRMNQAQELSRFSTEVHHHCEHVKMLCESLMKIHIVEDLKAGDALHKRAVQGVEKVYLKYAHYHEGSEQLTKDFEVFVRTNMFSFMLQGELQAINRTVAIYNEIVATSLKVFKEGMVTTADFGLYAISFGVKDIKEIRGEIDDLDKKMLNVTQAIASRLYQEIISCDFKMLLAVVRTPRFFKNRKSVIMGEELVDENAAIHFSKLLEK